MTTLIDIVLPTEELDGTSAKLAQWLFNIGDSVKKGQPIAELETDKVVMEICAPSDGILCETIVSAGDKIETDTALGKINSDSNLLSSKSTSLPATTETINESTSKAVESSDNLSAKQSISPAVRRLLQQNKLSVADIRGSGRRGRVTREDVRDYLGSAPQKQPTLSTPSTNRELTSQRIPHTAMRRSIAKHMVDSLLHISPHVTSVFEMNLTNIIAHRKWHKKEYTDEQINLTFTAYFLSAIVAAIKVVPQVNARFHPDALEIFDQMNIGVGTALGDGGLIVPVIQQVQSLTLKQIAKALTQQTIRAREGKITPKEMKNGTFTLSNHGVSGSLFAAPIIINQPEVAILGIGKMEKRVVVETLNGVDSMVIKPMCYLSLSIDHRALDAHQTNKFLCEFVKTIEHWGE